MSSDDFVVRVADNLDDIVALQTDWQALELAADSRMSLFQHFDWNWQWCKSCYDNGTGKFDKACPLIISVHHNGEMIGLWPLQVDTIAGVTMLEWLSAPALQYGGVLIKAGGDATACLDAAWHHITTQLDIDLIRLENVISGTRLHKYLSDNCTRVSRSFSSILKTGELDDWEAYQATLKKTARRARRKRYNKLSRQGDLVFQVHREAVVFSRLVKTAVEWKRDWLKKQNWPGMLINDDLFMAFLAGLAGENQSRNSPWVVAELALDGQPVAIEVGAVSGNRYYSYLGAFNTDYAKHSPGKIELELMIGWALENGFEEFDFLCVPSQYKMDWTNKTVALENFDRVCSLKGRLMHSLWVKRLRPAVKNGLSRIPVKHRKLIMALLNGPLGSMRSGKG
jgi:CelD/BcsL family acetyltransferase involved in cellulose biosynthesis